MRQAAVEKRIFVSVVTFLGDWRKMLTDVKRLGLSDISLFLTAAGYRERQTLYRQLQTTSVRRIPHVHTRHDMAEAELDFLVQRYHTQAFTLHYQYIPSIIRSKHRKKFFIENNDGRHRVQHMETLRQLGGACIDVSHLEEYRRLSPRYYAMSREMVDRYRVGCNHVSAVRANGESWHRARSAKELTYVVNIPRRYFSPYICFELANSIPEQLRFKKHITKLLATAWTTKP